jgi:release factor glutamine methyltransferase
MFFSVTVLEVIQRSTDFLNKKGVESPRLQAELLLAHVLKLPRMQLYLNFERELATLEQDTLRALVKRRGEREPLQHLVGSTSFCGLEIEVDRNVLIPRPETELLAEQGWVFLNHQASLRSGSSAADASERKDLGEPLMALDFGTGSGCLAIALAIKCPPAQVVALDISPEALAMAQKNALRHGVFEHLQFVLGDGLSAVPAELRFDLVVANPPYIPTLDIEGLEPEVRHHDPRRALDGGPDGLDFFRHLASAGARLKPCGKLMLEFGDGQEEALSELFRNENWIVERIVKDYTQRPRILIARRIFRDSGFN